MGLDLVSILDSRSLLLAICEQVVPSMNGAAARRLAAVLDEISIGNDFVDPADETWLRDAAARAEQLDRVPFWEAQVRRLTADGVAIISCVDPSYPSNLAMIHDRPPLLFVRGEITDADVRAVAVVGTRAASREGLWLARRLAAKLVESQITIVSGLAKGIDAAAHSSALDAGGRTIAVYGTTIDRVYPAATPPTYNTNAFDDVGGVNDLAKLWREPQERGELFPRLAPYSYHAGIAVSPLFLELVQRLSGCFGVYRGVNASQARHNGFSVFPAADRGLARSVSLSGACVSQFLPTTRTGPWCFPVRNVTTSGMSLGTIVVEAGKTSGAKMQAEAALAHGKRVFLVKELTRQQAWARQMAENPQVTVASAAQDIVAMVNAEVASRADVLI